LQGKRRRWKRRRLKRLSLGDDGRRRLARPPFLFVL
jgi:hypothetical protein